MPDLTSPAAVQLGTILHWIVVVVLIADGLFQLFGKWIAPKILAALMGETVLSQGALFMIGISVLTGAILYAIPSTAVLGAIVITGYLGGAIATVMPQKVFIPPMIVSTVLGLMTWAGLYLTDPRIAALIPFVQN